MWIEEHHTKKGIKYKYFERYKDPVTGNNKRVSVTMESNSTQATKLATRLLHEKITKAIDQAQEKATRENTIYFQQVANEWRQFKALSCKLSTDSNNRLTVNKLCDYIQDTPLHDVKAITIEELAHTMYHVQGLSYDYTCKVITTVKSIYRYAKKKAYIEDIRHIEDIELIKKPMTMQELDKKQSKFLDREELKTVLLALHSISPRISLLMEFMSLTGLRIGELLALRVCDYDKANKRVHINGTISQYRQGQAPSRGTPKNIYSVRYVSLNDRCISIIEKLLLENKRLSWDTSYNDQGYIFTNKKGNPYEPQYINKTLRKIHIEGKHLTTHIFRHTHISMLTELGVPLKAIMQRVGHNDPKTTLSVYSHVTESMQDEIIKKLNAI